MKSNRFVKIVYIILVTLILGIFTPYSKVSANEIGAAGFVRRCYKQHQGSHSTYTIARP